MIGRRKRPRRRDDKWALMRNVEGANVPDQFRPRKFKADADPEAILQHQVNETLAKAGQFHFRLSEHVLSRAGDWTVAGWPDNPVITKLMDGLCLLGPLELKRVGETLNPSQVKMQPILGTVEADSFEKAYAYICWYWKVVEHVQGLLRKFPPPPRP